MLIGGKKILTLPVYTKSGQLLGQVSDVEIDSEGQLIVNYLVGDTGMIKKLFAVDRLTVHRSQIISISDEKIVVDDNVAEKKAEALVGEPASVEASETVVTSNSLTQK